MKGCKYCRTPHQDILTFTVGEDGAVSANGVFVLYDEFTCDSADEIKAFFNDIAEVTEVQPEK